MKTGKTGKGEEGQTATERENERGNERGNENEGRNEGRNEGSHLSRLLPSMQTVPAHVAFAGAGAGAAVLICHSHLHDFQHRRHRHHHHHHARSPPLWLCAVMRRVVSVSGGSVERQ